MLVAHGSSSSLVGISKAFTLLFGGGLGFALNLNPKPAVMLAGANPGPPSTNPSCCCKYHGP